MNFNETIKSDMKRKQEEAYYEADLRQTKRRCNESGRSKPYTFAEFDKFITETELRPGDLLELPRILGIEYSHWAVYIGDDGTDDGPHAVIHFAADDDKSMVILKSALKTVWGSCPENAQLTCAKNNQMDFLEGWEVRDWMSIVKTAHIALKFYSDNYNVIKNNCEHFAMACRYGRKYSGQVVSAFSMIGEYLQSVRQCARYDLNRPVSIETIDFEASLRDLSALSQRRVMEDKAYRAIASGVHATTGNTSFLTTSSASGSASAAGSSLPSENTSSSSLSPENTSGSSFIKKGKSQSAGNSIKDKVSRKIDGILLQHPNLRQMCVTIFNDDGVKQSIVKLVMFVNGKLFGVNVFEEIIVDQLEEIIETDEIQSCGSSLVFAVLKADKLKFFKDRKFDFFATLSTGMADSFDRSAESLALELLVWVISGVIRVREQKVNCFEQFIDMQVDYLKNHLPIQRNAIFDSYTAFGSKLFVDEQKIMVKLVIDDLDEIRKDTKNTKTGTFGDMLAKESFVIKAFEWLHRQIVESEARDHLGTDLEPKPE